MCLYNSISPRSLNQLIRIFVPDLSELSKCQMAIWIKNAVGVVEVHHVLWNMVIYQHKLLAGVR